MKIVAMQIMLGSSGGYEYWIDWLRTIFIYYNMEGELMMDDKIRDNRQV